MSKQPTILVVEDEPQYVRAIRITLEKSEFDVLTAPDGQTAVQLAADEKPKLILLDIHLPDLDGYEVCRQIRRNWRTSQTPVIFLTDLKQRGERLAGLKLGAIDYLTKPYDVQELRLRVRNALSRSKFESLVDPVTGLPGEKLIDSRLQEVIHGKIWAIVLLSILGLEEFSERYGFVSSNEVLRATSLVLTKAVGDLGGPDDFVGDPGRGDFIVVTAPDTVSPLNERILTELKRNIAYFYPVADREPPADKTHEAVPVISIAMGAITAEEITFTDEAQVMPALVKRRVIVATVPH
jgi:PleD family two-component response regulator